MCATVLLSFPLAFDAVDSLALARPSLPQGTEDTDRVVIYPLSSNVLWNEAPPNTVVRATVGREGHLVAQTEAMSTSVGTVVLGLVSNAGGFYFQPDDVLLLQPLSGAGVRLSIPDIRADLDLMGNQIVGTSPEDLDITLALDDLDPVSGETVARPVDVQPVRNGVAFKFPLQGLRDSRPGDSAQLRFRSDGVVYRLPVAALSVEARLGERVLALKASLGTLIHVRLVDGSFVPVWDEALVMTGVARRTVAIPEAAGTLSGLRLLVSSVSPIAGLEQANISQPLPVLRFWVDLDQDEVHGTGPQDTLVTIQLRDPAHMASPLPAVSVDLRTDASGAFMKSFRPAYNIEGGWRVSVRLALADNVIAIDSISTRSVRATLYGQSISAYLPDSTLPITVTLRSRSGEIKARGPARSEGARVGYAVKQGSRDGDVQILPSDTIEIESSKSDPILVTVPPVAAQVDIAHKELVGTAPAGERIRVTYADQAGKKQSQFTIADDDGRYRFAEDRGLRFDPGTAGSVAVISARGDEFECSWVVPQMALDLVDGWLQGIGPQGQDVTVDLRNPSGVQLTKIRLRVQAGTAASYFRAGRWQMALRDRADQPLRLEPGDVIHALIGPDELQLTVPFVQVDLDTAADVVRGRTSLRQASVSGLLWKASPFGGIEEGKPWVIQAEVVQQGFWQWDLSDSGGLSGLDAVVAYLSIDSQNTVVTRATARGLGVDVSTGLVSGFMRPGRDVVATVIRQAADQGSGRTTTTPDGAFQLRITDSAGTVVLPRQGDEVVLSTGFPTETMRILIPRFEAQVDLLNRSVVGIAESAGLVGVSVAPTFRVHIEQNNFNDGVATTVPDDSGHFNIPFAAIVRWDDQHLAPSPGAAFKIRQNLDGGSFVQRSVYVPLINAEHGGSLVCGIAAPLQPVAAVLRDHTGLILAEGRGIADTDAHYSIRLRDASGHPKRMDAGQSIAVQVDGREAKLLLPPLKLSLETEVMLPTQSAFPLYRISGVSNAYTDYFVTDPLQDCFSGQVLGSQDDGRTGSKGSFSKVINPPAAGAGVEIAFRAGGGQRYFRHLRRLRLEAYVGTSRLDLVGTVGTEAVVELRRDGQVMARQSKTLDENGQGRVDFRSLPGEVMAIQPGDRVVADDGSTQEQLDVVPLGFDGDAASGLFGKTAPIQHLTFQLNLRDSRTLALETESSPSGTFALSQADLPPRRNWDLADVTTFRILATDRSGHHTVVAGRLGPEPPTPRPQRLFLPWLNAFQPADRLWRR